MRAVIQRVSQAEVTVQKRIVGAIKDGLLVLLGVGQDDNEDDISWLVKKLVNMRIFTDDEGKMNKSVLDIGGGALVISQFTLYASTKKGNRPSYISAAKPEKANQLYQNFLSAIRSELAHVEEGIFAADMKVSLTNDGPVTIIIDSKNRE
jgi:D-tyrosyl-tRNA(Tyr) deacylase